MGYGELLTVDVKLLDNFPHGSLLYPLPPRELGS